MKRIAIILGTRPEAIKLIPVYLALKTSTQLEPVLISTGQHKTMLDQVFNLFDIEPGVELGVMMVNQTLSGLTGRLFNEIGNLLDRQHFDAVLVQGDTTTTMVASICGFYHQKKVIHVEAGLRTYEKFSPFPEEINRRIVGLTADVHFAPTQVAKKALLKEQVENVYFVGNTVIDSLLLIKDKVMANKSRYEKKFRNLWKDKLILVTGHRRESFGKGFENICMAIQRLAKKYPEICFVYPVHLNPNVKEPVTQLLGSNRNVSLLDPLPYDEIIYLMMESCLIMTDSGGIQEEAPALDKPVIVMREKTERPEGVEAGCAVLSGSDSESIIACFDHIYRDPQVYEAMSTSKNPYGDGTSSQSIKTTLEDVFQDKSINSQNRAMT